MSVVPKFVSKRASKEFNRGYTPKTVLKGFLGLTLLGSVANAGNIEDGLTNWVGELGGHTATAVEVTGKLAVSTYGVTSTGGSSAIDNFDREFDGNIDLPSVEIIPGNGTLNQASTSGYTVENGDSYYSILGKFGMTDAEIAECDARIDLSNQPVLMAGQTFSNLC